MKLIDELKAQIEYWEERQKEAEQQKNALAQELFKHENPVAVSTFLSPIDVQRMRKESAAIRKKGKKAFLIEPIQQELTNKNRAISALEQQLALGNDRIDIRIYSLRKPYNKCDYSLAFTLSLIKAYREEARGLEAEIKKIQNAPESEL